MKVIAQMQGRVGQWVLAVALPLVVALVLLPLRGSLPNTAAALIMVVVVVGMAANGRRAAGLLASVSATVWFDLLYTLPYGRFAIANRDDIETTLLLLVVGAAVTELAVRGRWYKQVSEVRTSYLDMISATAVLAVAAPSATLISSVADDVVRLLGAKSVTFQNSEFGGLPRLLSDGRLRVADGYWDVDRQALPDVGVEILAECNGTSYGRFVVTPRLDVCPKRPARQVAKILADQVGTALARKVGAIR